MGGKAHHPSSSESDYWGDESWTVDCPCGVSFDDGEEMVECDECGVWVHTACCRVPKGLATFVCDKCKCNKKKKQEPEEAQPELPQQPSPPRGSPQAAANSAGAQAEGLHPSDLLRKPANEVPMHDRVHVQGPPGGDPSLFVDVPRVFSQQLWKFTGYVPKAFHTKCKDVPLLLSQEDAPERLLALLSSRKESSTETREEGKSVEKSKEEDNGNSKRGTTSHMEKHAKRDLKKGDAKHSKPGHRSSRSSREGKVQLHVKRSSEDLKRVSEDLKRSSEDLKRGSEDQSRKDSSSNKRMRTSSPAVKTEEQHSKEDEFSRSGGEPVQSSPVFTWRNPKAMKKMAVQEFMNRHVSALSNRCLNSEQIQLNA